jgi:hypothetical protein
VKKHSNVIPPKVKNPAITDTKGSEEEESEKNSKA